MQVDQDVKVQAYHQSHFTTASPEEKKAVADLRKQVAAFDSKDSKGQQQPKKGARAAGGKKEQQQHEDEQEGKLVLTNAVEGEVVTRFPPEASGFIHIGHAKAALVNLMLAQKYKGKMILRFDDTNPEKSKTEFENAILEDLESLQVKYDIGPTHSSSHFDAFLEYAEQFLQRGLAYCDTTPKDEMREKRNAGEPTPCRAHTVEENMKLWDEMKRGTELGQTACMRGKISVDAENGAMRDPTFYRVNLTPHPKTGDKYKVYPTYDFCCPLIDSIEGVTHALRTNEYHDRNAQYDWVLEQLGMRKPVIEDFSRLNMEYTLMSKRKLTACVADGVVEGWNDPRMPSVRGLLRRGVRVDALKEFVKVQGMSKAVNFMEWSKLWNFNVQILDPSVPRYTVVSDKCRVRCTVSPKPGGPPVAQLVAATRPRHRKNEGLGTKTFYQSDVIFLEARDVELLKEGEEVTLMDWGNAIVRNVKRRDDDALKLPYEADIELNLEGDVKKTKYKLTWVPENPKAPVVELCEFDHLLLTKKPEEDGEGALQLRTESKFVQAAYAEEAILELKQNDTVQLERKGYYRVDSVAPRLVLFNIPDGRDKVNHLSGRAELHPELLQPAAAGQAASAGGNSKSGKGDAQTLEEKRAAKAAKKAASTGSKKQQQ